MSSRQCKWPRRSAILSIASLLVILGSLQVAPAQNGANPIALFQNYFVTGDYVVGGWVKGTPDGSGFAPGTISIPDGRQPSQPGVAASVPKGADIVAAYLYWATVEGSPSAFAGQQAYFNGYQVSGTALGNPAAPSPWGVVGCGLVPLGGLTLRTYRADVRPFLPVDKNTTSLTYGTTVVNGSIPVRLTDHSKDFDQDIDDAPFPLGATLVVIYRVLAPAVPLNAIALYDGPFAPANALKTFSQSLGGFYQPATSPVAKITHIVANGQVYKNEKVYLNSPAQPLPSLYGSRPPFPGIYGTWDNPTWLLSNYGYVKNTDTSETTSIVPTLLSLGCVSTGAVVMSTTVQDSDGDGLLDVWENNQGYTDAVSGQWVPLPGANPTVKDLFAEVDYLNNLDGSAGPVLHSHLPKEAALDAVGSAFANQGIKVHYDLGSGIYPGDPYVIPAGTGGNSIPEGSVLCTDGATLCAYPGQPAIAWKGGFETIKNTASQGNFQSGRSKSYHYILFGHSLGSPRSYWGTISSVLGNPAVPQLLSIAVSSNMATVKIQSPAGTLKPGDCALPSVPGCADANNDRVNINGALTQTGLNGTYIFSNAASTTANNLTTTTFTIATSGVANGTYTFASEPQLAVTYLGPTSASGQSEFGGGADSLITLGLWGADDAPNCQIDPTQPLSGGQDYCSNGVGKLPVQTGTLMHELGHSLTLTHGGAYFPDPSNPSLPDFEFNCKPNFLSVMNYMFQVRGFVDGGFDYSSQKLSPLTEAFPTLSESIGLGADLEYGMPAAHLTRFYSTPNALDIKLSNSAKAHCDGSPLGANDVPAIRVDAKLAQGGSYSAPIDWNNNATTPDSILAPGVDLNYNGSTSDAAFSGFDDWASLNLQQIGGRENAFGYSGGGVKFLGGGVKFLGGGVDNDGGGVKFLGGGVKFLGGGVKFLGGGVELDEDTATATVDSPSALNCLATVGAVTGCTGSSNPYTQIGAKVPLSWTGPSFGQTRSYTISRAVGSYPTAASILANLNSFAVLTTVTGTPPAMNFIDTTVMANSTYTYFVTDENKQGIESGASDPLVVTVTKAIATVTLNNLNQVYTGTPRYVTASTGPSGLTVNLTYNGSPTAPKAVGSYTVVGTVDDVNYQGTATGTLMITQATATVTLCNLSQTYTGTPRVVTATTSPSGLAVTFTYNGVATPPTQAGSYTVVGTINNANYQGTATGTLVVAKATPKVSKWSTASKIKVGQTLASSTLTNGAASVPGTFAFTSPTTKPPVSRGSSQSVTFTPTDTTDYKTVVGTVTVIVTDHDGDFDENF